MAKKSSSSSLSNEIIMTWIKILLGFVFMGTLLIWIMLPTVTYSKVWKVKIRSKTNNSTYFGTQGQNLVMFMFPILFIAVSAGVYLHLGKKKDGYISQRDMDVFDKWRKPMIVNGPLGIVSGIELCFSTMFVALLVWSFGTYLYNSFATITVKSAAKDGLKVWEEKLESVALRLGLVGNIALAFLFFPVTRASSVLQLIGLTSESSIKYHIWLGHIVMTLFTAHGLCYIIFWATTHEISEMLKWEKTGVSNVAGEIALLAGLIMWITTFPKIRRKFFELFFYTHYLYIIFMIFFILHVGISYSTMMLPGFFLFLVDRYLRFLQSRQKVRLVSARVLPCDTLELNFSKLPGLSYNPTSTMFINVPSISKMQWHPFTITSSSNLEPEKMSVIIKCEGSWSTKLFDTISSPSSIDRLEVSTEGPYGPASTNFLRHDNLVMICGGSGITPFISIIRDLIFIKQTLNHKIPKITLVCAFQNSSYLTMLDLIFPTTATTTTTPSQISLQIEVYITKQKQPSTDASKLIRTVWFKPHAKDVPISNVLGPNNWLWLSAIISSSFVMFLVLIGVITRYHIFPIDHNTNKIYASWSRAVLNMLMICLSIMTTATMAVLWNKKHYAMEAKQVMNIEASTPVSSPASLFYNADRELESFPQQSLGESTNVYYGERPNIKRILLDCEESSVGVLVCGPKSMRHEAAMICATDITSNLHYEAISFNW